MHLHTLVQDRPTTLHEQWCLMHTNLHPHETMTLQAFGIVSMVVRMGINLSLLCFHPQRSIVGRTMSSRTMIYMIIVGVPCWLHRDTLDVRCGICTTYCMQSRKARNFWRTEFRTYYVHWNKYVVLGCTSFHPQVGAFQSTVYLPAIWQACIYIITAS